MKSNKKHIVEDGRKYKTVILTKRTNNLGYYQKKKAHMKTFGKKFCNLESVSDMKKDMKPGKNQKCAQGSSTIDSVYMTETRGTNIQTEFEDLTASRVSSPLKKKWNFFPSKRVYLFLVLKIPTL